MNSLILTNGTFERIAEYVRQIDAEIGMFGYVTMTDDGDFVVDEVFLVEQTVSGSSVDFADSGLEYAINKAIADDRIDDLKFCCHSHVDMGAFWSTTDEDMIQGMNNGMTPYLVSLVINKRHETKQRVDFYNPSGALGAFTSQITYDLDLAVDHTLDDEIAAEIDQLVTRNTWPARKVKATNYAMSQWLDDDPAYLPKLNAAGDVVGWVEDNATRDQLIDDELRSLGFTVEDLPDLTCDKEFAQDVAEALLNDQP